MIERSAPRILIADLVGLKPGPDGRPDHSEVRQHIEARGGRFHEVSVREVTNLESGRPHFFYLPMLATEADFLAEAGDGAYDALIAAASFVPGDARFDLGGVRIGAGTANMGSLSWGGGNGTGGIAPLMNTPGINSRATAQMVWKALMRVRPDLPLDDLNALSARGAFDTGRDLVRFPTAKLESQVFAVVGYGNIGREVAKLARAFGMKVRVHAREHHRRWIESEGFAYAATPAEAAAGADVLSVHVGLGPVRPSGFANSGLINDVVLSVLAMGAAVINFDRGELVDSAALVRALASGRVGHAAIDADLFQQLDTAAVSGPLSPYLPLAHAFPERVLLLPHAAADTDHPTRVAGAKQAVDQILDSIQLRVVRNLKGELPPGYHDGGGRKPFGVGGMSAVELGDLTAKVEKLAELRESAGALVSALDQLLASAQVDVGEQLLLASNRLANLLREAGLEGPFTS